MAETLRARRVESGVDVGEWPHPERTALVEGRGALLAWDVLSGAVFPAARVYDPVRAADWLWEVYGPEVAAELLGGAESVTAREDESPVRDACALLAHLGWVEAWWPASSVAGVPAVDPVLLNAELAVATAAVEHLLDDEDATARALAVATLPDIAVDPEVAALAARLAELADDHGVALPEPVAAPSRSEFALAAGGSDRTGTISVLSGVSPVDWAAVPAGVVDAAAGAEWAVVREPGGTVLEVTVLPAPGLAPRPRLSARFGDVELPLDGVDDLGRITGRVAVPPTVLLTPPARRVLTVYAAGFAETQPDPDASERRAAIIAYARSRVDTPTATITERRAGRR
ncbi:hypothetical protein V5P93_003553 [Actinokineospora auranticolor]|uniref:Uncharacterized protein n=1 Tax=Actinokineospora auranticolor TaxID=155976 RepID=A0A2S6GPT8_9PSEU|nr:hypothetical protein [Actinokineospora auranticolor]PPK67216.1 hypothetical protein CLV40_108214 [Actinokineospora auranticolor]